LKARSSKMALERNGIMAGGDNVGAAGFVKVPSSPELAEPLRGPISDRVKPPIRWSELSAPLSFPARSRNRGEGASSSSWRKTSSPFPSKSRIGVLDRLINLPEARARGRGTAERSPAGGIAEGATPLKYGRREVRGECYPNLPRIRESGRSARKRNTRMRISLLQNLQIREEGWTEPGRGPDGPQTDAGART